MSQKDPIDKGELQGRVLYSLLLPAVRLARMYGMSLKELRGWLDAAYFHELRSQGQGEEKTHREISKLMQVSERTVVTMSKRVREQFLEPETRHNLPLRIEFMLGAKKMGEGRLTQLMPEVEPEQVKAAIAELLSQGRIKEVPGRTLKYEPTAAIRTLPRDTWMSRIGGLNSLAANLTNAVYGRFFHKEPRTFARTFTFQGDPEVFQALAAFYTETLLPGFQAMDREEGSAEHQVQVSLCWAPYEYIQNIDQTENDEDT